MNLDAREEALERALRPRLLDEYVGQAHVIANLRIAIEASLVSGEYRKMTAESVTIALMNR